MHIQMHIEYLGGGKVGTRVARECPMCLGRQLRVHFIYERHPPGEFKFDFLEGDEYRRELHRCDQCGHFIEWINADMGQLYSGDYVEKVWGGRDGVRRAFERINALHPEQSDNIGRVAYIQSFLPSRTCERLRLLDVGTGLGVFPYRMKQAGWNCTAIDLDETLIAHVRNSVGIDARVADVTTAGDLGTFDLITFNKVLEHVGDPIQMLKSVKRLLSQSGIVYVELPDGEAAAVEGQSREEFLLGHIHVFSFASFALLIARAGLELVTCQRLREPSSKFTLRGMAKLAATEMVAEPLARRMA